MIGDPKQAIYGFRGGDIEAYLAARRSADVELRLATNYRSSSALIAAFNGFYALAGEELSQSEAALPDARIAYEAMTAGGRADAKPLLEDGLACERPLVFHVATDARRQQEVRRDAALVACADLIAQVLQARRHSIRRDAWCSPATWPCCCPTNRDIERLRRLLGRRRVPCVEDPAQEQRVPDRASRASWRSCCTRSSTLAMPPATRAALARRVSSDSVWMTCATLADAPER